MKTKKLIAIATAILFGQLAMAAENVILKGNNTAVSFGDERFLPQNAIHSDDGMFYLYAPNGEYIDSATFLENYDSMCEFEQSGNGSVVLRVGASSAESSQCVLKIKQSDGKIKVVTGYFNSGE